MHEAVVVAATRTPLTRSRDGLLANERPDEALAQLIRETFAQLPALDYDWIEDLLVGCATQEFEQGLDLARLIVQAAGLPNHVGGVTLNRMEGSALTGFQQAVLAIRAGQGEAYVAAGVEFPSRIPAGGFNPSPSPQVLDSYPEMYTPLGLAAENAARQYKISREEQDQYAVEMHRRARQAQRNGLFDLEIRPVRVKDRDHKPVTVLHDDAPRDTALEELAGLKPAFLLDGTVTAGNSAPFVDGAAVLVVTAEERARASGLTPLARVKSLALTAGAPNIGGEAAAAALRKAAKKAGLGSLAELGEIELYDDSAAAALAAIRQLSLDRERVNRRGGALALGRGAGHDGARLLVTLLHRMEQEEVRLGAVVLGATGGQGLAVILERE